MAGLVHKLFKGEVAEKQIIIELLQSKGDERMLLFEKAAEIKAQHVENKVYYRGLVEISNICKKNCYYCGIRRDNTKVERYFVPDEEILNAVQFAYENQYGSVVLQSGERCDIGFVDRITELLQSIRTVSKGELRVTLSLGEQTYETYKEWFENGAQRYLLRIETSNAELYRKLHPDDEVHSFENRLKALKVLKEIGYQTGTGVMIGLPFQTYEHLADDLLFMKNFDIHMVGMGPYIEHAETPLHVHKESLLPLDERFDLTLKMIAILRIMMPDINIAATTALQTIDKLGREKAIKIGANVLMPNITPGKYRDNYFLYDNKPCTDENAEDCKTCLEARVHITNHTIAYGEWGDSKHYTSSQ